MSVLLRRISDGGGRGHVGAVGFLWSSRSVTPDYTRWYNVKRVMLAPLRAVDLEVGRQTREVWMGGRVKTANQADFSALKKT